MLDIQKAKLEELANVYQIQSHGKSSGYLEKGKAINCECPTALLS